MYTDEQRDDFNRRLKKLKDNAIKYYPSIFAKENKLDSLQKQHLTSVLYRTVIDFSLLERLENRFLNNHLKKHLKKSLESKN